MNRIVRGRVRERRLFRLRRGGFLRCAHHREVLCLAKIPICREIKQIDCSPPLSLYGCKTGLMLRMFRVLSAVLPQFFRSRRDLLLENLALRQQLAVLRARHPQPRFSASDRLFWVILRRLWLEWKQALILVQPETVFRWHRDGFKVYWRWISRDRSRSGRRFVSRELREIS